MLTASTPELGKAFIVLTDNHWLYAGLAALQPDVCSYHVRYRGTGAERVPRGSQVCTLLVDGSIFYEGAWGGFLALRSRWPQAAVVWLVQDRKGVCFPSGHEGDRVVRLKARASCFKAILREKPHQAQTSLLRGSVTPVTLSATEACLLPHILGGKTVHQLSARTGRSVKTLYGNQSRILKKMGFRSASSLQYVFLRNFRIYNRVNWLRVEWGG